MSEPYYSDDRVTLWHADCREVLANLPDATVDACVTDPPYELGFMGKGWDASGVAYDVDLWRDVLRVLKPGGHLLAFGGSRTWHRLACAVEDAGFEIRDGAMWVYASGFPKSLDVSKAIDKAAGVERPILATIPDRWAGKGDVLQRATQAAAETANITAPATPAAQQWQGWGTALKPAFEPIVVARKPLAGTVAANVLAHGAGALNIDGCRVATGESLGRPYGGGNEVYGKFSMPNGTRTGDELTGRWPSNVVLSHAPDCGPDDAPGECVEGCPVRELDEQSGTLKSGANPTRRGSDKFRDAYGDFAGQAECVPARGADSGGASRFFPAFRYEPKAPTDERPRHDGTAHPTVKPLDLMRWLVRLVTPPGGVVLEPFAGSGTTCEAAVAEGFRCIAVEQEAAYLPLITQRLTKRSDPVAHLASKGEDLGLFELLDGEAS